MKKIIYILLSFLVFTQLSAQTGFSVSFGTQVNLSGDANLVLNDMDLEAEGGFGYSGASTVLFSGSSSSNGIYSDSDPEFYNLKVSKSAGDFLTLNSDILIENDLNIDQGKLDLGGFTITLDGGQIVGEDETNYITGTSGGKIDYIAILNNPDQENPGNLGIEITSVSNLGQTVIRRGHEEQTSNEGGKSIHRYFEINPVNNSGLNAILRIYYNDLELNGIPESELEPWRSTDGGNTWALQEGSLLNTSNNWVQLSGVDAFSRWTLASETTSPLPVELSFFRGEAKEQYNLVEWETFSEENVSHFELQKLENQNWISVGRVEATHFSTDLQAYSFDDFDFKNLEYYRLQVVDYDGKEDFSKVISIERSSEKNASFTIYPNPVQDYLFFENEKREVADKIRIFNVQGTLMNTVEGVNQMDLSNLIPGIYFLEAQFGHELYTRKITKVSE